MLDWLLDWKSDLMGDRLFFVNECLGDGWLIMDDGWLGDGALICIGIV